MFYYVNVIDSHRIDNPDSRITRDCELFCNLFFEMFYKLIMSPMRIVYYIFWLIAGFGWVPVTIISGYCIVGSLMNWLLISPLVVLKFKQESLEGDFRFSHVQIRTNSESIAFYHGQDLEKKRLNAQFGQIVGNLWRINFTSIPLQFFMGFFGYIGSILNYLAIAFLIYWAEPGSFVPKVRNFYILFFFLTIFDFFF